MAGPRFTPTQREERREKVADFCLSGRTQLWISKELGVSRRQIWADVQLLERRWIESANKSIEEHKARILGELERVKREAWERHWASIGEHKVEKIEKTDRSAAGEESLALQKLSVSREQLNGSSEWLNIVGQCIARQCAVLGLNAPIEQKVTGDIAITDARERIAGELDRIAERRREAFRLVIPDGNTSEEPAV